MSRRIIGSLVGALAAASLAAPVAHAGTPAHVSVRIEAPGRTLADTTLLTTTAAVKPDGANACSGTSAGGALWQAVGRWSGTWYASFGDYTVDAIDGVRGAANGSTYWAFWLNGTVSSKGVCGTELQAGDKVLEFLCDATPDFSSCTNLPLDLSVVDVTRHGKAKVKVVLLDGNGRSTPIAGATVRGGVKPVTTAADGTARLTLVPGQSALRATKAADTPSGSLHCQRGAHSARCGSRDTTPPTVTLKGIANGQAFTAARAPRVLRGTAVDPSGATVALRLTRHVGTRCTRFDATRGTFRACAVASRAPFAAGDRAHWSYLLPAKLAKGSYRLDVIATDGAGNRRTLSVAFIVGA